MLIVNGELPLKEFNKQRSDALRTRAAREAGGASGFNRNANEAIEMRFLMTSYFVPVARVEFGLKLIESPGDNGSLLI